MSVQLAIKVPNVMQMPASIKQSITVQKTITKMSCMYEPLFSSIPLLSLFCCVFRLVMFMRRLMYLTCFAFVIVLDCDRLLVIDCD